MIVDGTAVADGAHFHARLVIIGAGPAGIVSALEAARRGIDVVVVETGNRKQQDRYQRLSSAHIQRPELHAPVELTVSRQVGGTSSIWGGRCVPYDPVDFARRPIVAESKWPIEYADVVPYFESACRWLDCGRAAFTVNQLNHLSPQMIPGLDDGPVLTSTLERWSLPTDVGKRHFDELRDHPRVQLITDSTCVRIEVDPETALATNVMCKCVDGRGFTVTADDVIVAAGGLESTRLLMCSPGLAGRAIGDHSGHLGRWYMAHLEGVIADLVLSHRCAPAIYDYERDVDGSYVRRRFTFTAEYLIQHDLPNIAGWIANPEIPDASHGNANLSLTYLALISPLGHLLAPPAQRMALTGIKIPGTPYGMSTRSSVATHLLNIVRHPIDAARFLFGFAVRRVASRGRKPPGFFVGSAANRYPFQYHAEHLPNHESRAALSNEVDEIGMRKLDIDIRFTDRDIDGVLRAHQHWDKHLRDQGIGKLEYLSDDAAEAVRARTGGGFHQVGTTRMSRDPEDGVVDENLAVHGIPNIHVASSSVFTTSGQANSTFMIVVFALRLIDRLYGEASN